MIPSLSSRSRTFLFGAALLLMLQVVAGSSGPSPEPLALSADMAITSIVASPSPTVPDGSNLTYTINYINNGPDTPGSTSVSIQVPIDTTFVSMRVVSGTDWIVISQPSGGGTGSAIWRKGDPGPGAASGETAQFELVVAVTAGQPNNRNITGTANAYSIDANTVDPTSSNNSKSVTVYITSSVPSSQSDLAIAGLTASPTPGVMVGSNITYTIDFANNGPDTATSASVKDAIPANTTFVSMRVVSGTGWNLLSTPPVGGTGNAIFRKGHPDFGSGPASGETAQFEVVVAVNAATPHYTTITNTASTYSIDTATIDPVGTNNATTVTTHAMVVADPFEPNDTSGTAAILPLGTTYDLVHSGPADGDPDWYKFFVPPEDAGKDLRVNVRITSAYPVPPPADWSSDLDWELLDESLGMRAVAVSASDNETLYIHNVAPGWYYAFVGYCTTDYADTQGYARYAITAETGTGFGLGYISGRVVDGDGQGIAGVFVSAQTNPAGWIVSLVTVATGGDGSFFIATNSGSYKLSFTGFDRFNNRPSANVVNEYYSDKLTWAAADVVSLGGEQALNLGDVTLDVGAIITGQVTNTSGTPLANATVASFDLAGNQSSHVFTDASGNYTLDGVPVGGAKLRFNRGGYATEFYNDQPSFGAGTTLATESGVTIPGLNAQLSIGGTVTGFVRDPLGAGLSISVRLYSVLDGTFARAAVTSEAGAGAYSFTRVKPGGYRVYFDAAGTVYSSEWYRNAHSFAEGTELTVWDGGTFPGFDADLTLISSGDFTGDLKSDVLWRHNTLGEVWVWPMDGTTRTAETFVRTVADTDWEIRAVADFTGDGKTDIMWRNKTSGQIYLWPMNGTTPTSEEYVGTVDLAYDIVSAGDYSGDGKADLLWRHTANGDLWAWMMGGATILDALYVATVDPGYAVAGSGDLNGDGACDVVWRNETNGEVWVWVMNGTPAPDQTLVAIVPDAGYKVKGVADFTGDGKADILWHHDTRGEVWLWTMNGATRVSQAWVATVSDTEYRIVGSGDYDGDRKADILWHHATRGEVWVWLMNGATPLSETWVATVPDVAYQIWRPGL